MTGYMTKKLFDCLYVGTIPLHLGAPDISSLIPPEAYIDCRNLLLGKICGTKYAACLIVKSI